MAASAGACAAARRPFHGAAPREQPLSSHGRARMVTSGDCQTNGTSLSAVTKNVGYRDGSGSCAGACPALISLTSRPGGGASGASQRVM